MENIFILLAVGAVVIFLLLQFEKTQKKKVKTVLKEKEKVEPLFLKQAAELKLAKLRNELKEFENAVSGTNLSAQGLAAHGKLTAQLDEASAAHAAGSLTLSAYCNKVDHLLSLVRRYQKELEAFAA